MLVRVAYDCKHHVHIAKAAMALGSGTFKENFEAKYEHSRIDQSAWKQTRMRLLRSVQNILQTALLPTNVSKSPCKLQ